LDNNCSAIGIGRSRQTDADALRWYDNGSSFGRETAADSGRASNESTRPERSGDDATLDGYSDGADCRRVHSQCSWHFASGEDTRRDERASVGNTRRNDWASVGDPRRNDWAAMDDARGNNRASTGEFQRWYLASGEDTRRNDWAAMGDTRGDSRATVGGRHLQRWYPASGQDTRKGGRNSDWARGGNVGNWRRDDEKRLCNQFANGKTDIR
jgi:hypothetical protein